MKALGSIKFKLVGKKSLLTVIRNPGSILTVFFLNLVKSSITVVVEG